MLLTVHQVHERHPGIQVSTLRQWTFYARERNVSRGGHKSTLPSNGFETALRRIGRKVLIDEQAMLAWIERGGI